jgi:hypothetical protein
MAERLGKCLWENGLVDFHRKSNAKNNSRCFGAVASALCGAPDVSGWRLAASWRRVLPPTGTKPRDTMD